MRSTSPSLDIDGAHGEGGGQLLRTAAALAALTGTAIRVHSIRAKRPKPGLAAQHLAAVRAVATLCNAHLEGAELHSQEIVFAPGRLHGGEFAFDVGTAGSVTLVLQALLPVMIAAHLPFHARITGGTDIRAAPPLDYTREVMLPLLARLGAQVRIVERRRGYFPRGGGEIEVAVAPRALKAMHLDAPGRLQHIGGIAHVAHLPAHIPERMRASALEKLGDVRVPIECHTAVLGDAAAIGQGGALVMWAQCEHTTLGASRAAERGVRAEAIGETVGNELAGDLAAGVTLDLHASDQILCYLALAGGESSFTARELTSHAETAMWLIGQFLPARFEIEKRDGLIRVAVSAPARRESVARDRA